MDSLDNFRAIRGSRLFRSATVETLTEDDISTLKSMGVKHIIDSRTEKDLQSIQTKPVGEAFTLCKVTRDDQALQYEVNKSDTTPLLNTKENLHEHMHYIFEMNETDWYYKHYVQHNVAWYKRFLLVVLLLWDKIFRTNYLRYGEVKLAARHAQLTHMLIGMFQVFQEEICTGRFVRCFHYTINLPTLHRY
jgi:hypothetical protein